MSDCNPCQKRRIYTKSPMKNVIPVAKVLCLLNSAIWKPWRMFD